jgi:F-type H+-transporting ATPase subunit gamma
VHLLSSARPSAACAAVSTRNIAKLAREHAAQLLAGDGKTVKILTVGKKGYDILKREFADLIIDRVDLREVKRWLRQPAIARRCSACSTMASSTSATLFYSEFKSVISQVPTAQQLIPAACWRCRRRAMRRRSTTTSRKRAKSSRICCRATSTCRSSGRCLKTLHPVQGARMSAMDNATRNAGEMIDKLTMSYNRQRQAQITKELIEIISGAEAL